MDDFWKTVLAIVAGMGGGGVVFGWLPSYLGKLWADRYMQKNEHEFKQNLEILRTDLTKQTEMYKAKVEGRVYISKVQFETEYNMFIKIFSLIFDFVTTSCDLFPAGLDTLPQDIEERKNVFIRRFEKFMKAYNEYSKIIETNAPFIEEKIYQALIQLRNDAYTIACMYPDIKINPDPIFEKENAEIALENHKKTQRFKESFERLKADVRAYLSTQKVVDAV